MVRQMKKNFFIIIFLFVSFLVGCELNNTPTSKVEEQLSKYQMLDKSSTISYTDLSKETGLDNDTKKRYENLIKKQYQNLSYEVKEETIDGEIATVKTQIELIDYQKIIDKYDKTSYMEEEYHNQLLTSLEKATDKITYTINFIIKKDEQGNWQIEPLTSLEKQKLLGINTQNPEAQT